MTIQQALLMSPMHATWNPSDKDAGITLSNGNLTATTASADSQDSMVRASVGKSSGKWYWEISIASPSGSMGGHAGIATSAATLSTYVGEETTSWGMTFYSGNKVNNATGTAYGSSFLAGDVMGIALDMDGGTLTFYKNGVSQGQAFSGLSGTLYPAYSDFFTGDPVITANFGATAFTYTPPAGHGGIIA